MIAAIASAFRTMNVQLLYRRGIVNKLLKGSYLLSVFFFKRWVKMKRTPRLVIINNYDGDMKIQVDLSKTMGASLFWTGFHEFNEMRFLNRFLREDMTFVDVGANQGEFSLFASRRLPKGRVLAFEPMSLFFDRLTFNVRLNGITNVQCYKFGLSDRKAEVPIYFNAQNNANHEGLASVFSLDRRDQNKEIISLSTLDEVLKAASSIGSVDFIKIDVEGSEWAVLKGSQEVLRKYRPALMVELNDETAALAGYSVEEMITWLQQFGYVPLQIARNELVALTNRPSFCNAVFLAP